MSRQDLSGKRAIISGGGTGISGSGRIYEHSVGVWDRVLAVNLRGPFLLARYVSPIMRAQKSGYIINISSASGLEYYPGGGSYGVSELALNTLGEYIPSSFFKRQNLVYSTLETTAGNVLGGKKPVYELKGQNVSHDLAAQAQYVHVVVLNTLRGRVDVVTQASPDPLYLVGGDAGAHAAAAH